MNFFLNKNNPPLIIIGCHRSGTSIITNSLRKNKVFMGQDTYAHDESYFFQQINEYILKELGASWHTPDPAINFLKNKDTKEFRELVRKIENILYSNNFKKKYIGKKNTYKWMLFKWSKPLYWGWKDPRNTITLPVWLSIFPNARILHVHRHGFDVANSLYQREIKRNKTSQLYAEKCTTAQGAFTLWKEYEENALSVLQNTHPKKKLSISYEYAMNNYEHGISNIFNNLLKTKLKKIEKTEIDITNCFKFKNNQFLLKELEHFTHDCTLKKLGY